MAGRLANSRRPVYKLKDYDEVEVKGVWYPEEFNLLQRTNTEPNARLSDAMVLTIKRNCLSSGSVGQRNSTRGSQSRLHPMSAPIDDKLLITLPRTATHSSPRGNRPSRYETRLAHPLGLDGVWEAALINFTYPHEWTCLDRDYRFTIAYPAPGEKLIGEPGINFNEER